jgi:Zn-dependent M28 family amino/carboxypeptidase
VDLLADPALGGRDSGSDEERAVAVLLARTLSDLGIEGAFEDGGYCQPFTWRGGSDQNVAGVLRRPGGGGRGPAVILGAHYDGQGRCGSNGEVCPSADDNASGVAALLEAARLLAARRSALRGDVVIAFFGAEEQGIMGSTHFARHPPIPFGRVERMINLDMVGRQLLDGQLYRFLVCNDADAFGYVVGGPGREATEEALERAAGRAGIGVYGIPEGILVAAGFSSDSVPFSAHVPTLFLSTSIHDDYHRPGDVTEKVDLGQVARAVRLVTTLALDP